MNRDKITFPYTVRDVRDGSRKKKTHHTARMLWWSQQKQVIEEKIKETGVVVTQTVENKYNSTAFVPGVQMQIDHDLQRKHAECTAKITHHKALIDQYDHWDKMLTGMPSDNELPLQHDDWIFFFAKL